MSRNRRGKLLMIVMMVVIYIIACGPQKTHKTLSFFFDGVPEFKRPLDSVANEGVDTALLAEAPKLKPEFIVHIPYKKNECNSCHDQNKVGGLVKLQPGLCYHCHDDFNETYSNIHGPADGGYCTNCHNPHYAKEEKLLNRTSYQLCFSCHDSMQVTKSSFHRDIKEINCTECHNPHGGEDKYLLEHGACYKCHDDYSQRYKILHGPVAGEYCSACHESHSISSNKMKGGDRSKLCLKCHNEYLLTQNDVHKGEIDNCINCHNPHGGDNRYFTEIN